MVTDGIVMITSMDKISSSMIRKAFKIAKNADAGILNEFRFGEKSVFAWIDNEIEISKKEIRELAKVA